MKGKYITPKGETMTIVDFDEINKMVCVSENGATNKWYHEPEYSTWVKENNIEDVVVEEPHEDTGEIVLDYVSHEETVAEEPKKKKKAAPKKKSK